MNKKEYEVLHGAVKKWGIDFQISMVEEECAELILAIKHFKRGWIGFEDVIEEMADIGIMLDQMKIHFGSEHFDRIRKEKINRLASRLITAE